MVNEDENRQQLVNAGAIPVLVSLLNSPDTDVQYYCTTALSNIAVDGSYYPLGRNNDILKFELQGPIGRSSHRASQNLLRVWLLSWTAQA